jgi:hypothetical protein
MNYRNHYSYPMSFLFALALMLRRCSAVNTRLASEASAKDGLKGILERSRTSFCPNFHFISIGVPIERMKMGNKLTSAGNVYAGKVCLLVLCVSLSLSAESVRLLNRAEINKKMVSIEKKIVRDTRIMFGLKALAHAQEIYIFWSLVAPLFTDNTSAQFLPLCIECKARPKAPIEEIPFVKALWSGLTTFGNNTKNLFTTRQGWWTIGGWGAYYGTCLAALYVTLRMPDSFIHPDTLRWYVQTYAPYEATMHVMKDAIINLQDQSLDAIQISYNKQLLHDSLDRLARYGESICAYMAYKFKQLDEYEQPIAQRAARNLFTYNNAWLKTVSAQCELDNPDYDAMNKLIVGYELAMAAQLKHFYAIEGETKAERRVVMQKE